MYKKLLIVIPLVSAVMFSGCATIISGKKQKVNVSSIPSNQEVAIGMQEVITPAIIEVERGEDLIVSGEGCNQKILAKQINPVFFVNILSGGVFGSTTDYASDAMWKYDENVQLDCRIYE